MLRDLEQDSIQLVAYRRYYNYASNNIDTLEHLIIGNDLQNIPTGKLYWYGLFGGAHRYFVPNDETFQQMKSSGSLRYFGQQTASSAAKYDRFCRVLQSYEQMGEVIYGEVRKSRAQIFDFRYNEVANTIAQKKLTNWNYSIDSEVDSFTTTSPPLLSHDKILFNQYIEMVRSRFMRVTNVAYADSLLNQASKLIGALKKDYRLENE